ncbi:DNA damage-inducible protein 1 [Ceratobasidium sp. 414]|nr:DNA damage-inducible protein 1 [Ceratobasidium sp. 414]
MRVSFITDTGETYQVEVDPQVELENIMALLEAECGIPVSEQSISHNGADLVDPKVTLSSAGVQEDAMLLLRRKAVIAGRYARYTISLYSVDLALRHSKPGPPLQTQPELADAIQNHPQRFAQLLRSHRERQRETELASQREIAALNADPFDVEAQRRIEENIRQQAVLENMEHAMEYSPEFFGRVTMLYIPVEVNGVSVKAFVDSGAQQTIMSPDCAEKCGLLRLLDIRFSGIAKGVGTAKILGRVHSAQLKLADLHLPCAFTIMEASIWVLCPTIRYAYMCHQGRDVDLLFGLDMLKAHQACIDLEKGVLRIKGREVHFLAEHELPDKARLDTSAELEASASNPNSDAPASAPAPAPAPAAARPTPPLRSSSFPGGGNTLGSAPASGQTQPRRQQTQPQFPESSIQTLVGLGADREQAIQLLHASRGDVEVAASLLFSS